MDAYRHLEDFDDIAPFLEPDPEGFELPFNRPPFVPGK